MSFVLTAIRIRGTRSKSSSPRMSLACLWRPSDRSSQTQWIFDRIKNVVKTGNYRLPYYLEHKAFYDRIAQENVFNHFSAAKPTHPVRALLEQQRKPHFFLFCDRQQSSKELGTDFNFIIKLHPFLIEYHPAHMYALKGRYEGHPSAHFLTEFPPIYPLLEKSVCYIGDYSSIGYDFLAFDRPFSSSPQNPLISRMRARYIAAARRCFPKICRD